MICVEFQLIEVSAFFSRKLSLDDDGDLGGGTLVYECRKSERENTMRPISWVAVA